MTARRCSLSRKYHFKCMNRLFRGVVLVAALGLVLAVMALLGSRSGSRGALLRYNAELKAKGEKLTFAELMRERMMNGIDSHAVITNATATLSNSQLSLSLLEPRKYLRSGEAMVTWREASPLSSKSRLNGRRTWEEHDHQIKAAGATLQEIRDALREPALDGGPCTNMLGFRRVNFVAIRTVAQWLAGAVENDLHQGRWEEGLQNLEALAALARMEREEYTLVAQMVRVGVAGLGLSVTWEAMQAPGWSEQQLARLQQAWEQLDLVDAVEKGVTGDRASGAEVFAMLRHANSLSAGGFLRATMNSPASSSGRTFEEGLIDFILVPAYKLTSIDEDELFFLTTQQQSLAGLRFLKTHRPWAETKQELAEAYARLNKLTGLLGRFRYMISSIGIPNCGRASERAVQVEIERQLTLAAIGLRRFELRHGKLPPSLEALLPEFLAALPYDYMSAKPLGFRLKSEGSYVLYSVGDDGKDDGGDPTPPPGTPAGLWGCRDAVWPSPVAEPAELTQPRGP
jgi:hypothetical protein